MGSNQFQREYIEYLQERNAELQNKLITMKENYENKIFSRDLSKNYLISMLEDVLNVCVTLPSEIDLFFDKMSAAMGILKNILLKKSEMVQLADKISRTLNPSKNHTEDLGATEDCISEQNVHSKFNKKGGTVRVSPMIYGHVISTEPRIYLNRVPESLILDGRKELCQLSPIVEASPDASSDTSRKHNLRDLRVPIERLNPNKLNYKMLNEESPRSRFKGPKTWKKSLSDQKGQRDAQRCTGYIEDLVHVNEDMNVLAEVNETAAECDVNPLEGPSWLYANGNTSSSPEYDRCFVDFKRRKHRFASVFDKNEDIKSEKVSLAKDKNEDCNNSDNVKMAIKKSKEFTKKSTDSCEDIICESMSEVKEKLSSGKCRQSTRVCIEESSDEEFTDNEQAVNRSGSTHKKKSLKSESYYESDNEGTPSRKKSLNESYRKRYTKSLFERSSTQKSSSSDSTFKTLDTSNRYSSRKALISKKITPKEKNVTEQGMNEESLFEVEDCSSTKKPRSKRKSSKGRKKVISSRIKRESCGPPVSLLENGGRKKRKAAPSNLTEPSLTVKLRRP